MVFKYILVIDRVVASAPKINAKALDPNIPIIKKTNAKAMPIFIPVVKIIFAFLSSFWDFNIPYLLAPPIPIINPIPLITLYTDIDRLRAARTVAPKALDTKNVSAKI